MLNLRRIQLGLCFAQGATVKSGPTLNQLKCNKLSFHNCKSVTFYSGTDCGGERVDGLPAFVRKVMEVVVMVYQRVRMSVTRTVTWTVTMTRTRSVTRTMTPSTLRAMTVTPQTMRTMVAVTVTQ